MNTIHLSKKNFAYQIVRYGLFADLIPDCFSSEDLANKLSKFTDLINTNSSAKKYSTSPLNISTYKNDISRRILSVPNPMSFLKTVMLYEENWDKILSICKSPNSLSPITNIRSYDEKKELEIINCDNLKERLRLKSDYIKNINQCIRISLGLKYLLKIDIANFYDSIYTHSITWAICGKEKAKEIFYKHEKNNSEYNLGEKIDTLTRYQKNNQTDGIITGPFTSRIFSEIILSALDVELQKQGFIFKRFVDDYKFYFRTDLKAMESIQVIEKTLNNFSLHLNDSKTEIKKFPYEKPLNLKKIINSELRENGIYEALQEASNLYLSGEKGAYKYVLKCIRYNCYENENFDLIIPLLINIMLIDPRLGKYVSQFLEKNKPYIDSNKLSKIINIELTYSLEQNLQQETLIFMYMIKKLKLNLIPSNFIKLIQKQEDLSLIIGLDIWKNNNESITDDVYRKRGSQETKIINNQIKTLIQYLYTQTYFGPHWLLLHEIEMHSLLVHKTYNYNYIPVKRFDFFEKLKNEKISFYIE